MSRSAPWRAVKSQVLATFRRRDVAAGVQHGVVGGQRVGGHEIAQVALDDAAVFVLDYIALHERFFSG